MTTRGMIATLGIFVVLLVASCRRNESAPADLTETYTLRFVFEGAIAFYEDDPDNEPDWQPAKPLWVLLPNAAGKTPGHPARIYFNIRDVNTSGSTPLSRRQETLFTELDLEEISISPPGTGVKKPYQRHPRLQDPQPVSGGNYGQNKRDKIWLANIERFQPGQNGQFDRRFLDQTINAGIADRLAARMKLDHGTIVTHRLEGDISPADSNAQQLSRFDLPYPRDPSDSNSSTNPSERALANSMAVEMKVSGNVSINLAKIGGSGIRSIHLNARSSGEVLEIHVENLPLRPVGPKPGEGAGHFRLLYLLLEGTDWNSTQAWQVPIIRRFRTSSNALELRAADEACPPGCFGC